MTSLRATASFPNLPTGGGGSAADQHEQHAARIARSPVALEPLPLPPNISANNDGAPTTARALEQQPASFRRQTPTPAPLEATAAPAPAPPPTQTTTTTTTTTSSRRAISSPPPLDFGEIPSAANAGTQLTQGTTPRGALDEDPLCVQGLSHTRVGGLPIKTGTGYPMGAAVPEQRELHPAWPDSGMSPCPPKEPLASPTPSTVNDMQAHDAARMTHPEEVRNRVIYDSVDPNPLHAPAAGGAEAAAAAAARGEPPRAFYEPANDDDTTLVFESRFESGNLRRAIQVYADEYDLILRPDINTRGHTQWFYFSIANTRAGKKYKLNIINLVKRESLFQNGMRVLVHSRSAARNRGVGWRRAGTSICYYQNNIRRRNGAYYYTLTFTIEADHDNDLVHVAYCYPYTYTDLQQYLHRLESCPVRGKRVRRRTLCHTLAGNLCDLLTITTFHAPAGDPGRPGNDQESKARSCLEDVPLPNHGMMGSLPGRKKRGVFLSGRVHPGESNASWVVKGVLDFLTGPGLDARLLRDSFCFKIVPMLNPDGVINGNYRCNLAGADLNRTWNEPSRRLHPTVYHTKQAVRRLLEERGIALFCDFHGHSRRHDVFVYGCERKGAAASELGRSNSGIGNLTNGGSAYGSAAVDLNSGGSASLGASVGIPQAVRERVFPKVLSDACGDRFRFASCKFKVQSSKESTARVVCYQELGVQNSYTLEATFAGSTVGELAGMHLDAHDLLEVGRSFCLSLLDYCDPSEAALSAIANDIDVLYPQRIPAAVSAVGATSYADSDEGSGGSESEDGGSGDEEDKEKSSSKAKRTVLAASARGGRGARGSGGGSGGGGDVAASNDGTVRRRPSSLRRTVQ